MTLTVPATPLLCMRTEAGQLFYLQFGQMYVILFLTVPAAPIPCALESARHADQSGSFIDKRLVYNNVVTALRKHPAAGIGFIPIPCFYGIMIMSSYAKVSGDHPWDFGSKAREPLVLKAPCLLICGIIVSIHYCEGGRQMASTKGSSPLTKGPSVLLQSGAKV